jgi:protocatechuate 3,4-dioxygenase beta subunit
MSQARPPANPVQLLSLQAQVILATSKRRCHDVARAHGSTSIGVTEDPPMANIKRRLYFCSLLVFAILAHSETALHGQTPDAKSKASASVAGRVTFGEKPAPGITVIAHNQNSANPVGQATSDAEGNYRINGLPNGQLNITPVAPIYVIPNNAMFGPGRVVNLSSNEAADGVDFKLVRGGVITGRITDADGRPVIEERITLLAVDENGAPVRTNYYRPTNFMMYQTDDRGVYRIYGLSAGRYKVSVGDEAGRAMAGLRASGYFQKTFYPDVTDITRALIVEVLSGSEAKNIDIKVGRRSQTYSVSGRVIDADTNKPVPNIQFSFGAIQQSQGQSYVSGTSGPATPTNSQGEFRVEGLAPGRYVFLISGSMFNPNASGPKFYSDPIPFEVFDSDVTNLEIKAQPGLSISGLVVPDGITDKGLLARLSRLVVTGLVESGPNNLRVYTGGAASKINPDGSFSLEGLQPGKASINVGAYGPESQGFSMTRIELNGVVQGHTIDLAPGQSLSGLAVFVAYGSGVVRGQIKVEGGTLASDAAIFVTVQRQGEANANRMTGQVDSRGRFVIKGIPAGTYEVVMLVNTLGAQTLFPRGFQRQQRQTVNISDGVETDVSFTLDLTQKDGP